MKEFFSKVLNKLNGILSFKKINPHLHWRNLLYIFFMIMAVLILFSFYLLYQIKNQQIFQSAPTTALSPNLMNEKLLNEINKSFDIREVKQNEIKDAINTYKDPSLK
jgi:type VI protein secretion system component VasK